MAQNASLVADPSFRLWNQSFAASTLLMHAVAAATVCSPASTHMLVCICMLFLVSIGPMVHPMDNFDSGIAAASDSDSQLHRIGLASLVSQKVMGMGFIYLAAVGIVLTSILVDAYSAKAEFFLLLCFMDGFMLFGHLWDRVPTLQVIFFLAKKSRSRLKTKMRISAGDCQLPAALHHHAGCLQHGNAVHVEAVPANTLCFWRKPLIIYISE